MSGALSYEISYEMCGQDADGVWWPLSPAHGHARTHSRAGVAEEEEVGGSRGVDGDGLCCAHVDADHSQPVVELGPDRREDGHQTAAGQGRACTRPSAH
jgi:hypothetical protein